MADFSFKEESIKAKANIVSSAMEKALEEIQKAERCIKKCIDIISDGDELEELDFPSQNSFYEEIEEDIYKIKRFGDLCWSYDREVDKPFADSYERLLEKVSQIKTEDIKIKNNIGVTEKEIYFINSSTVEERDKIKEEISFEDVLGYGDIGKLIKANYEIYLEQVGSETGYITLDDYISSMVKAGEFNYKIIPEWQEYLSLAIDCVPIIGDGKGILESVIGVDLITGRELSSLERGLSLLSVIPLIGDYAVIVKGAQKVVVKEIAQSSIKGLTGVGLKKYAIKEGSKYALKAFNKEFLINSLTMVGSNALTGFGVSPVACLFLYQGGRITLKNWKKFKEVFGNTTGASKADNLWIKSTCNNDELYNYLLKNVNEDVANKFLKEGKWPDGIQIPKNSSVVNPDGSINWSKAAEGGYTLSADGTAIKQQFNPQVGEVIDRYGNANGRYTSPIINGDAYSYTERSLPYVEDLSNYHQYEVVGDFTKIKEYVDKCTDIKLKTEIETTVRKYYKGDYSRLASYKGNAAAVEGWGKGGAIQYEFSLTVKQLEGLGLLKEIK